MEQLCKPLSSAGAVLTTESAMFGVTMSTTAAEFLSTLSSSSESSSSSSATGLLALGLVSKQPILAQGVDDEDESAVVAFVNEWLGAVADAIVGLVVVQLCRITVFSNQGRAQLHADIEYLKLVLSFIVIYSIHCTSSI